MLRSILLCLFSVVFLLGCQTTATEVAPKLTSIEEYLKIPLGQKKWKVLVLGESRGGEKAIYAHSDQDISKLIPSLIKKCFQFHTGNTPTSSDCRVAYLGNDKVVHAQWRPFRNILAAFIDRPYKSLMNKDVCDAFFKPDFKLKDKILFEIKMRYIKCSLYGKSDYSKVKIADDDLCFLAAPHKNDFREERMQEYKEAAYERGLNCGMDKKDSSYFAWSSKNYEMKTASADIAIIIGNQDYKSNGKDIPNVPPAKNDAQAFYKFAQSHLGIEKGNIIFLKNATTSAFERTFGNDRSYKGDAYNWVKKGKSNLYVYYAGHGAPGEDGSAYLIPSDATASTIDLNGYPIETLYKNLSMIPSKSTTVILESCFSGNSASGSVITNASPVYMKAKYTRIPSNLNVISAGSANQLASWTKDKRHGLFTYHYLKGMRGEADGPDYGNGDGTVDNHELKYYLEDTVTYYAKRHYGRSQNVQITLAD